MPEQVIETADKADRIEYTSKQAKTYIKNKIGLTVSDLGVGETAAFKDQLQNGAKKVEFVIGFKDSKFTYTVRAGALKLVIDTIKVEEDRGISNKAQVFVNMKNEGIASQADVDAFRKKNELGPLKKRIDELKKRIKEAEDKIKPDKQVLEQLEKEYKDNGGK